MAPRSQGAEASHLSLALWARPGSPSPSHCHLACSWGGGAAVLGRGLHGRKGLLVQQLDSGEGKKPEEKGPGMAGQWPYLPEGNKRPQRGEKRGASPSLHPWRQLVSKPLAQ